nr:immunoglobulin heavy chain junction region [Macaca mulatta]
CARARGILINYFDFW